ncbi:RAMP superfamily CRISPR-associated protein [Actinoalloteichus spitiensis]|uniref:RAMP superfamily CRISPR-associated protein n=1 Tax=Actinoalloteichus spitiensis TaxID=252394 RepID=UPI0012F6F604|nr:RAMP superfamily CRISPR-associated protein [Actinoalloteichus spitiensis]
MDIDITFHGPFRVGTGTPHLGVAETVDPDDLLPPSSLKGVMRASAELLLPTRPDLVAEVFGASGGQHRAAPWHWGPVAFTIDPVVVHRARIAIDPVTNTAREGSFFLSDEVWCPGASFSLLPTRPLDAEARRRHRVVLTCAAAGVHNLGGDRRRGLGWVSLRPRDGAIDDALLEEFEALRAARPGGRHA